MVLLNRNFSLFGSILYHQMLSALL